ncbi:hypothetical protein IW262DRAFT_1464535 [Armillaria fumosa]|nr:hypothetical protein IW262DRAFT_1464535 [Armillaria fumosa]
MEFTDASPANNPYKEVYNALKWLRSVPAPFGAKIGIVGDGRSGKLHEQGSQVGSGSLKSAKISFSQDKLVFTQSDIGKSNFFIDKSGKICILDFQDVVLLPESFASYTKNVSEDQFWVAEYLEWPPSFNEDWMKAVFRVLGMLGDTTLGFDENGLPVV